MLSEGLLNHCLFYIELRAGSQTTALWCAYCGAPSCIHHVLCKAAVAGVSELTECCTRCSWAQHRGVPASPVGSMKRTMQGLRMSSHGLLRGCSSKFVNWSSKAKNPSTKTASSVDALVTRDFQERGQCCRSLQQLSLVIFLLCGSRGNSGQSWSEYQTHQTLKGTCRSTQERPPPSPPLQEHCIQCGNTALSMRKHGSGSWPAKLAFG